MAIKQETVSPFSDEDIRYLFEVKLKLFLSIIKSYESSVISGKSLPFLVSVISQIKDTNLQEMRTCKMADIIPLIDIIALNESLNPTSKKSSESVVTEQTSDKMSYAIAEIKIFNYVDAWKEIEEILDSENAHIEKYVRLLINKNVMRINKSLNDPTSSLFGKHFSLIDHPLKIFIKDRMTCRGQRATLEIKAHDQDIASLISKEFRTTTQNFFKDLSDFYLLISIYLSQELILNFNEILDKKRNSNGTSSMNFNIDQDSSFLFTIDTIVTEETSGVELNTTEMRDSNFHLRPTDSSESMVKEESPEEAMPSTKSHVAQQVGMSRVDSNPNEFERELKRKTKLETKYRFLLGIQGFLIFLLLALYMQGNVKSIDSNDQFYPFKWIALAEKVGGKSFSRAVLYYTLTATYELHDLKQTSSELLELYQDDETVGLVLAIAQEYSDAELMENSRKYRMSNNKIAHSDFSQWMKVIGKKDVSAETMWLLIRDAINNERYGN